jgi:outer membrane autotransporter protein
VDTINRGGEVLLYNGGVLSNYTGEAGTLNVLYDNTLKGQTLLSANAAINFGDSAKQSIAIENLHSDKGIVNMKADLETHTGDKLNITSSYDGSALISLKNTAPSAIETTGDGIKLVEFDAGASVNGTFDLLGGQWDESGYIYKLYRGDEAGAGRDYYLRSTAEYSNILATMVNTPIINNMLAMMGMNSLQKRLGDLRNFDNNENKHGIWARTYGEEMNIADLIETDMTIFSVEAGYDYLLNPNDDNKLYIGFMGGYEKSTRIKTKQENGAYNKGEGDAPSAGIYGTMIWENGWFVDLAARHFLMKLDMKNYGAAGTELSYKPKRHITTVSLEAGRAYLSNPTGKSQWRIEPKGELMYMRAWAGDTGVNNGTGDFEYDGINYISARATITAGYLRERASGLKMEPYLEAGYRYEFDGKGNIRYGGAEYQSDLSGGTLEGTIGLDWQFTKDLYGYLQGTYEKGSKIEAFGGNVGIRYGFGGGKKAAEAAGKKPEVETRAEGKEAPLSAPVELGKTITIGNAHFAFARAELSETIKAELRKKGEELKKMSYERIKIVGHADSTGTDRINNPLSERRARAVAEYLIESGAQRDKVVHWGEGSKKPAASNATKEGRALNRRVEVTVE